MLEEDSKITITSPGFPIFIPLVVCEWNITLSPENNASINFKFKSLLLTFKLLDRTFKILLYGNLLLII